MRYRHVLTAGEFTKTLTGLWCGANGLIYATGDSRVCIFGRDGAPQRDWSTARPGLSIAVRNDGAVFVGQAGQIEVFDQRGSRRGVVSHAGLGEVTAIGFAGPRMFAADATDRSIRRYEAGKPVLTIGKNNRTNGFAIPNGVLDFTVDANGDLCIAHPGKHRIERYTADGELKGHFGRFDNNDPAGFPGCCNPTNIGGGGKDRRFYVTEKAGPRAKCMDADGGLIGVIATDAFDPMCKNMRIVAGGGRIYVADTIRLRVLAFEAEAA